MSERTTEKYRLAIADSGLDIYSPIAPGNTDHYIPTAALEELLNRHLVGLSLAGFSTRTRSKVIKQAVCEALGYPVPERFRRSKPRFPGQDFDTYIQQALNLQIWNDEIVPTRRYVLLRVDENHKVRMVKVILGADLLAYDTTGTITTKYQARLNVSTEKGGLLSILDTASLRPHVATADISVSQTNPTEHPTSGRILPIAELFSRLKKIIGSSFCDTGGARDRNRGAILHELACKALGYQTYQDNGQFPDIRNQLLEIKLQTSRTIDLGLVLPTSAELIADIAGPIKPRHCDTRYAIFAAVIKDGSVRLTCLYVVTGEEFFQYFQQFGGLVTNRKIQLPLPRSLFGE